MYSRALTDATLSKLADPLVTSFVYSHDVVSRLSLGSIRDLRNAALWLCDAESNGKAGEGWAAVTSRAKRWKAGAGSNDDPDWVCVIFSLLVSRVTETDAFPFSAFLILYTVRRSAQDPRSEHAHDKHVPARARVVGYAGQRAAPIAPVVHPCREL